MKHPAKSRIDFSTLSRNQGCPLNQLRWFSHQVWRVVTRKFPTLALHLPFVSQLCQWATDTLSSLGWRNSNSCLPIRKYPNHLARSGPLSFSVGSVPWCKHKHRTWGPTKREVLLQNVGIKYSTFKLNRVSLKHCHALSDHWNIYS